MLSNGNNGDTEALKQKNQGNHATKLHIIKSKEKECSAK